MHDDSGEHGERDGTATKNERRDPSIYLIFWWVLAMALGGPLFQDFADDARTTRERTNEAFFKAQLRTYLDGLRWGVCLQ